MVGERWHPESPAGPAPRLISRYRSEALRIVREVVSAQLAVCAAM